MQASSALTTPYTAKYIHRRQGRRVTESKQFHEQFELSCLDIIALHPMPLCIGADASTFFGGVRVTMISF